MDRVERILRDNIKYSGFFKLLLEEISDLASNLIPCKGREEQYASNYFNRLEQAYRQAIKTNSWIRFWQNSEWLDYPNSEDIKLLPYLSDYELSNIHLALCYSLKVFQDSELDESLEARKLHDFYKLTKAETNKRETTPQLPEQDAFEEYAKNKSQHQEHENRLEKARKTGSFCPYCDSKNVVSDGHSWKCKDCGKYFRKH